MANTRKCSSEGESGGGLALPVWIDVMARVLRGVPAQPLAEPWGAAAINGDWRYEEFALGGFSVRLGEQALPMAESASAPGAAQGTNAGPKPGTTPSATAASANPAR